MTALLTTCVLVAAVLCFVHVIVVALIAPYFGARMPV